MAEALRGVGTRRHRIGPLGHACSVCARRQVADNGGCDADDPTKIPLQTRDYIQVIITTLAEFPGLVVGALLVDKVGRKPVMSGLLALCGGATLLLLAKPLFNNEVLRTTTLFVGRASITGMFMVLYTYTPEVSA